MSFSASAFLCFTLILEHTVALLLWSKGLCSVMPVLLISYGDEIMNDLPEMIARNLNFC